MTEFHSLLHPRKIGEITEGEIADYGSSDGGTTWHAKRVDISGGTKSGGTSKTIQTAKIDINTAARHEIVAATAAKQIIVVGLFFTLSSENDITLEDGATALTGAMPFGGTNEVRGMTENWWPIGIPISTNTAFNITLSSAQQVSGLCLYYKE
ncbi:MAG: hypothetical protein KAV87_30590 [Desulfobacteraceae bacterium]|nr:hypothetical protein [Desulfobacteraceae bacterium]